MSTIKKELYFWKRHFNIQSIAAIPQEMENYTGIHSDENDEFMRYLTTRVSVIQVLDFEGTNLTDEGVKYISKIQKLKKLTLRDHQKITKACLPFLNKLIDLEFLDISKTDITLEDVHILSNLQNLKELHISMDESKEKRMEMVSKFREMLPQCNLYVDNEKVE